MNEQAERVLTHMESLVERYDALYNQISERFSEIERFQESMKNDLSNIKKEADEEIKQIDDFREKMKTDVNDVISEMNQKNKEFDKSFKETKAVSENILSNLNDKYTKKAGSLINKIDTRSKEIFNIYSELEEIKRIKDESKEKIDALERDIEEDIQEVLGNFEKDSEKEIVRLRNIDVSNVKDIQKGQEEINAILTQIQNRLSINEQKTNKMEEWVNSLSFKKIFRKVLNRP